MSATTAGPSGMERRRAARVPMPPTGGAVAVVGGRILNVSPYGMMIESPVSMKPEAVMRFRLMVNGAKADVEARVAACTPLAGGRHRYGVGLEFTHITAEVPGRLRAVLAAAV